MKCIATTLKNKPCSKNALANSFYCYHHKKFNIPTVVPNPSTNIPTVVSVVLPTGVPNIQSRSGDKCSGMTKAGKRCKKKANKTGYCHLHIPKSDSKCVIEGKVVDNCKMEDCSICYETNVNENEMLNCKHYVCKECISKLRDDRCPMCRQKLSGKLITNKIISNIRSRKYIDIQDRLETVSRNYIREIFGDNR
jgi:hypothetical protein